MPIRGAPPRVPVRAQQDTRALPTSVAPSSDAPATSTDGRDRSDPLPRALDADLRLRASALSTSGPTRTKVPDLLGDWNQAVIAAAARDAARAEMWPDATRAVREFEQQHGAPLREDEVEAALERFFQDERTRFEGLERTYLHDFDKDPRTRERTIQRVVVEERPRVQQLRDPFTPIVQRDPAARAREVVLWENHSAMVLVDLFAPCPKALVVPKPAVMLAQDCPPQLLSDLALVAARVSDAFMDVTGRAPAGIWVNPPQDLSVRQMHVHVLPDLPDWQSFSGVLPSSSRPLRAAEAAQDPRVAMAMRELFQKITQALEKALGPSS